LQRCNSSKRESLEQIKTRVAAAIVGARLIIIPNGSPSGQHSLLVDNEHALAVAQFLREAPSLRFDYASNVTGVDWLDAVVKKTIKVKQVIGGVEKDVDQAAEEKKLGYLEAIYHLYSMELKHGPIILRLRTGNRAEQCHHPSLTPVWRRRE